MIKVGDIYWEVAVLDGSGAIEWDQWIVRTIRGGKIYVILKTSYTWGKLSKRHGDFGRIDPIEPWCRKSWRVGEDMPKWYLLATTKRGAILKALKSQKRYGEDGDYKLPITNEIIIKKLQTMLKRAGKK